MGTCQELQTRLKPAEAAKASSKDSTIIRIIMRFKVGIQGLGEIWVWGCHEQVRADEHPSAGENPEIMRELIRPHLVPIN